MFKKVLGVAGVAGLAFALAAPALAQSHTLRANISFEFQVGEKVMPAGDYFVQVNSQGFVQVMDVAATDRTNLVWTGTRKDINLGQTVAKLVFNRYGNQAFLSEVWDGTSLYGYTIAKSHTERELARTASTSAPEILTVLARR